MQSIKEQSIKEQSINQMQAVKEQNQLCLTQQVTINKIAKVHFINFHNINNHDKKNLFRWTLK